MPINSYRNDEESANVSKMHTLLRLFAYLKPYKKEIFFVLLIMAYCVTVTLLNPLILESAIDDYIRVKDFTGLFKLCAFALALNCFMIVLIKLRMYMMAKVCNKILLTIRQELYTHIQTLDFQFFDSRPTGKILARIIGDINALKEMLSNSVTSLIPDFITVCAVVVIMFAKNAPLAGASLIATPFMAISMWLIQIFSHKKWQIHKKKSSNMNAFIHEDLSGIRIIQSFSAEKETVGTFRHLVKEHCTSFLNAVRLDDGFGSVVDLSWGLGYAALYFSAIVLLGIDVVSVGTLIAFGTYLDMFWNPIMNLSNFYTQLITNISGAERIFEILDTPSAITDGEGASILGDIEGEVRFEDVSFSYDGRTPVLEHVNFTISPGETIALVGPTGAGKSTIVSLISRFYDIQSGHIYIDGKDIKTVSIESLRTQMGIMTQDNFLFSGSIRENIRYGKLDATEAEIIAAAKAVSAHNFISKLDHGYDTHLQERGGGLSIGQKQLLAFARTMLSMPKILILDEATSSIDTQTEILVQRGIEALLRGRTSFVIAHRLSTIQKADRIFFIDKGGILEAGNEQELLAKRSAYYSLYMSQFKEVMTCKSTECLK